MQNGILHPAQPSAQPAQVVERIPSEKYSNIALTLLTSLSLCLLNKQQPRRNLQWRRDFD